MTLKYLSDDLRSIKDLCSSAGQQSIKKYNNNEKSLLCNTACLLSF